MSSAGAKGPHGAFVQFVGIRDFGNAADSQSGCQAKRLPHILVADLLQGEFPKGAGCPGGLTNQVTGGVRCFKRALQGVRLVWRGVQFHLYTQFHGVRYTSSRTNVQAPRGDACGETRRGAAFIPLLGRKSGGFLKGFFGDKWLLTREITSEDIHGDG